MTKTGQEKWIRTQWRIRSRVGQHGDKEKISELGRMDWKLASFMMSSTSEGFEALGFPLPCNWHLVRMPSYVGNDSLPVWSFTSLAQAAGLFAGSWSGPHNTGCQMGFAASCQPSVGSNIPSLSWGTLPSASGSVSPGGLATAGEGGWTCWFFFLGCQELCSWDSLRPEGVWVAGMLRR